MKVQVYGEYQLTRRKADTLEVVQQSQIFPNLITDLGLDRMGIGGNILTGCYVGTSSTPPAVTDTQLGALLASTTNILSDVALAPTSPDWQPGRSFTYRFGRGVAAGNLTEIGVGWGSTTLFSRALIVDGGGTPTTFVVLSDEVLDVSYTVRCVFPLTDSTYNVTIAGVDHTVTARLANAASSTVFNGPSAMFPAFATLFSGSTALGPVTGLVNGTNIYFGSGAIAPVGSYVNGTFNRSSLLSLSESLANSVPGISGALINTAAGIPTFINFYTQFLISPPIMKDATKIATLQWNVAWGRYTP